MSIIMILMPKVDELLSTDADNAKTTKKFFYDYHPDFLNAFETGAQLYITICRIFGQQSIDDDDLKIIESVGKELSVESTDHLWSLLHSTPPENTRIRKLIMKGRSAVDRMSSRRARSILLLTAYRSYMWAITDLLRLRLTAAFGHFRLQAEAFGLMSVFFKRPETADKWFKIQKDIDGKRFYRKLSPEINEFMQKHSLSELYNISSGAAQHARFASVIYGFSSQSYTQLDKRVDLLEIKFQEIDANKPHQFILNSLFLLRSQARIFATIKESLLEVDDPILLNSRLPNFNAMIERLWVHLKKAFPDQYAKWQKRYGL